MSMTPAVFDWWRKRYDEGCPDELHKAVYWLLFLDHTRQDHVTQPAADKFIADCVGKLGRKTAVSEIGGWCGDMAARALSAHTEILYWNNIEFCDQAAWVSATSDTRYSAHTPEKFRWWFPDTEPIITGNVFFASHVIEHFTEADLMSLLNQLARWHTLKFAYLEAPLRESDIKRSWHGYNGTHMLPLGWLQVRKAMSARGWATVSVGDNWATFERIG